VVGGKEGLLCKWAASGYLQNGLGFYTEKSSSKQTGSAKADLAVSCSRLQYIMSAQLWMKAISSF
jgi:hypothetical protein